MEKPFQDGMEMEVICKFDDIESKNHHEGGDDDENLQTHDKSTNK